MTVRAKKSLGQHFLADPNYCRRIVHFAEIQPTDTVLEIGPGTGQLTKHLLVRARRVIAIEFDRDMVAHLRIRFAKEPRLTLIQLDVLTLDWDAILKTAPVKIVGNLPYNISTRVLTKTTEIKDRFHSFTFMIQKEVAERVLATPGSKDYGYFTLVMEYHFERVKGFDVPPGSFVPKPKVTSHVMKVVPRDPPYPVKDYDQFLLLLKKSFQQRRKTLWNNLKPTVNEPRKLDAVLKACHIRAGDRPEEVTLEQYACLSRML